MIQSDNDLDTKIRAHVSKASGISNAIARDQEIGCEAIQIFGSSPQSWAFKTVSRGQIELFRQGLIDSGTGLVFLHAIFLINLATPRQDTLGKGIESLINYMNLAAKIGAGGVIVRPGSHGGRAFKEGLPKVLGALKTVLDASLDGPALALENMAGMGQHIEGRFDELANILEVVDSSRLRICLDAQHAFAAGYDLSGIEGIQATMNALDAGPGCANVVAVHANDSKRVCGSGVDYHDNIGDDFIGEDGLAAIMSHPGFSDVPCFLEVPGFDGKGPGLSNINILEKIRRQVGLSD